MTILDHDHIIRPRMLAARLGISRRTLDRMVRRGEFAQPIRITTHAVGWRSRDVEAWLTARAGV